MMFKDFKNRCFEIFKEKEPLLLIHNECGAYFKLNTDVFKGTNDGYEWRVYDDWHRIYSLDIRYIGWQHKFIFQIATPMGKMQYEVIENHNMNTLAQALPEVFRAYVESALKDN